MSNVFKALADPTRRKVLQLLRHGPLSAGELAEHFDVTKPTMSAHFAVPVGADLIQAERQGRSIIYRLKMSVLEDALLGFTSTLGIKMPKKEKKGCRLNCRDRALPFSRDWSSRPCSSRYRSR